MFKSLCRFLKSLSLILALLISSKLYSAAINFQGKCAISLVDEKGKAYPLFQSSDPRASKKHLTELIERARPYFGEKVGLQLTPEMLDTNVIRENYQRDGKLKYFWGTVVDRPEIFYSLLMNENKVSAAVNQGLHPIHEYGKTTWDDHKATMAYIRSTPVTGPNAWTYNYNEWSTRHRTGAQNANEGFQIIHKIIYPFALPFLAHNVAYKGGGEFRDDRNYIGIWRSRFYDKSITDQGLKNILGTNELLRLGLVSEAEAAAKPVESVFDTLVRLGFLNPPADKVDLYKISATHWTTAFRKPKRFLNENGEYRWDVVLGYPDARILDEAFAHLEQVANREMQKIKDGAKDAYDPITLAALVGFTEVYLHFAKEGNGRSSKTIKNLVLHTFGLPFDLRFEDHAWHDIDLGVEEYIDRVRLGVFYAANVTAKIKADKLPTADMAKIGLESGTHELARDYSKTERKLISKQSIPDKKDQVFTMGTSFRKNFIFKDHLWQGEQGVLYTYFEGKMYPVTEWLMSLYGQGGTLFQKRTNQGNIYNLRMRNESFKAARERNQEIFKALVANRDLGLEIEVVSYDTIAETNKGLGKLFMHPFQLDSVKDSLEHFDPNSENYLDPLDYPLAVLATNRGNQQSPKRSGPTGLQKWFTLNQIEKIHPGHVAAAHKLRRIYLRKLELDLEANHPALLKKVAPLILMAKKDAYEAAKTLLKNYKLFVTEAYKVAPGEATHPKLAANPEHHRRMQETDIAEGLYEDAISHEWFYETWELARKKVRENKVVVMRNIAKKNLQFLGLITEKQQAEVLFFLAELSKKVDGEIKRANREDGGKVNPDNIKGFISRLVAQFASEYDSKGEEKSSKGKQKRINLRSGLDKMANGIFVDYHATRGLDKEFDRSFFDFYMHTVGAHPQLFKSTTTNVFYNILLNPRNQLKFAPDGTFVMYELDIAAGEVADARYSPYVEQAEAIDASRLGGYWFFSKSRLKLEVFRKKFVSTEENLSLRPHQSLYDELENLKEDPQALAEAQAKLKNLEKIGEETIAILEGLEIDLPTNRPVVPAKTPMINQKGEWINPQTLKPIEN